MSAARDEMDAATLESPSDFLKALRARIEHVDEAEPPEARPIITRASQATSAATATTHSIVFVASEAAPYSKTGGLGDVVASLPQALAAQGHRVMVVTPKYMSGREDPKVMHRLRDCDAWTHVDLCGSKWVNFHHERRAGVDWVCVQHEVFERHGGLYTNEHGDEYHDNVFRCENSSHLQGLHACPRLCTHVLGWTLSGIAEKVIRQV